jgi:hypothetical protein
VLDSLSSETSLHKRQGVRLRYVIAGWLVCAIGFTGYELLGHHHSLQLRIQIYSSVGSQAQLFWDTGAGYNEKESSTEIVSPPSWSHSYQTLSYQLPDKAIRGLRFDPITSEGSVSLRDVEIRGAHGAILRIPPSRITGANQIQSRLERSSIVTFITSPGANDPQLLVNLDAPIRGPVVARRANLRWLLMGNGLLLALAVASHFWWTWVLLPGKWVRRADEELAKIATRIPDANTLGFDSFALWFYCGCLVTFLVTSGANLNGSSTGVFHEHFHLGAPEEHFLGTAKVARSDEWAFHTPDILNQALRADRFAAQETEIGNHYAGLLGNIPVWHVSSLFRPQFWGFFFLPPDYGFAIYWQFKAFILLTGVFSWLLVATGSSRWAIVGSLWYFFSPMTQWDYSWASALPEMIGSLCWATALCCFLAIGRSVVTLGIVAIAAAICAINFALCAYLPHMLPLMWIMVFFFIAWCVANRDLVFHNREWVRRALALSFVILVVCAVGISVFLEVREAIVGIANTIYPGKRAFPSASLPIKTLMSHFFSWTETERHFPPVLSNICEASGVLWLAPVTLFCWNRVALTRTRRSGLIALWTAFLFLFCWLTLPVPMAIGKWLALQNTGATRTLPALGLANVAIVVLCLSGFRHEPGREQTPYMWRSIVVRTAGIMLIWSVLLGLTNRSFGNFFSRGDVIVATFGATVLTMLLLAGQSRWFVIVLLGSHAILFGAVNPVTRGLPVILQSELFQFVHQKPDALKGKWIIFSDNYSESGYFSAMGCNVYTGLRYLPDIDHFKLFASRGWDLKSLNNDWFVMAVPIGRDEKGSMHNVGGVGLDWRVYPGDPILRMLDIKYAAFDTRPDPKLEVSVLKPLVSEPVDNFWLYELR